MALDTVTGGSPTAAFLNGTINPNGLAATAQFEYGLTASYSSTASVTLSPNNGTTAQAVSAALTGLMPYRTYHYRLTATNSAGTVSTSDATFSTGAGNLDPSFNGTGKVTTAIGTADDVAYAVATQSDGKIVAAGTTQVGSVNDFALVRYQADGSLDPGFGTSGEVTTDFNGLEDRCQSVAVQSDGKIVAVGYTYADTKVNIALARYTAAGALDATFGTDGKVMTVVGSGDDIGMGVVVQPDGKIVVAGYTYNGSDYDIVVVRYTSTGALDATFGSGGKVITAIGSSHDFGRAIALQADGKIVVAGESQNPGWDFALVRYQTDGSLDASFGPGGKVTTAVGSASDTGYSVAVQSDGKIVVAGETYNGSNWDFALARYTANGSLDASFGTGGKVTTAVGSGSETAFSMALQGDGKILVAGYSSNGSNNDMALVRYTPSGSLDTDWGSGGKIMTAIGSGDDYGYGMALQNDGAIVVAGKSYNGSNYDFAVVRYYGDLLPAVTLNPASGVMVGTATISGAVNPNGSATTAQFEYGLTTGYGNTASVSLSPNNGLAPQSVSAALSGLAPATTYHYRLTATNSYGTVSATDATFTTASPGSLDVSFNGTGKVTTTIGTGDDTAKAVAIQSDGKMVLAGFGDNAGNRDFAVARYNADGTLDSSFGGGTGKTFVEVSGVLDTASSVVLQSDGKIVVGGTIHNGTNYDFAVVRLTAAGALDTTFNGTGKIIVPVNGGHDYGYALAIQDDGKIVLAGESESGGQSNMAAIRLNPNGTLDSSFGTGGKVTILFGTNASAAEGGIGVRLDGKIVLGGWWYNGSNYDFAAARLNSDGTLDSTFGVGGVVTIPIGGGTNEDIAHAFAMQPDGKIILAGHSRVGSYDSWALARLTASGALDTTFGTGGKTTLPVGTSHSYIYGLAIQPAGEIVAVGHALNAAGDRDFALGRFLANGAIDPNFYGGSVALTPIGSGADEAYGVALQKDGGMVAVGRSHNGSNYDFAMARYYGGAVAPDVWLGSVSLLTSTSATLNGSVTPNGLATTAQFEYGLTTSYGNTVGVTLSPNNGAAAQAVSASISGLAPGTTYYYRLIATNSAGTTSSTDSFRTQGIAPTVTTEAVTNLTASSVTLNGTAIPVGC